jgi:hypothetical protein
MLEAYFDESGTHADPREALLILAGYIADEEEWKTFYTRWKSVLDRFQLPRFHMKDIQNFRHPLFKHLSADDRRSLVVALIDAIADTAVLGTLHYMRLHEYKSVTTPPFRSRYGSAYGMLLTLTLLQLGSVLINPLKQPETIRVFLEAGHANANDALRLIKYWQEDTAPAPTEYQGEPVEVVREDPDRTSRLRIADFGLGSKENMYPLHAADMLAYLASSALSFKGDDFLTGLFDTLLPRFTHLSTYWDKAGLEEVVAFVKGGEKEKLALRTEMHELQKYFRSHNVRMSVLPWGYTIDARHLSEEEWLNAKQNMKAELEASAPRGRK